MKSNSMPSDLEILTKLERNLTVAAQKASSPLAKFVFAEENREIFAPLIHEKKPEVLVQELNDTKLTPAEFKHLQITIANKNDFKYLFDLPIAIWFDILLHETIHEKDLIGLFGSEYGAIVGILETIEEFEDPFTKALTFYYLTHSRFSLEQNLLSFLKSLNLPEKSVESFADSFRRLHFIIVNRRPDVSDDGTSGLRAEMILNIQPDLDPAVNAYNQKRVKSIIRLITECVNHLYEKNVLLLTPVEKKKLLENQDSILANQEYLESVWKSNPQEFDRGDKPIIKPPSDEMDIDSDEKEILRETVAYHLMRQLALLQAEEFKQYSQTRPPEATTTNDEEIIEAEVDGVTRTYRFRR